MQAAVRPYVTAGVALVGAVLIAVTPIAPRPTELRSADLAVRLAAASVANIIPNLFNDIASIPANELLALGTGTVPLGALPNSAFSFTPSFQGVSLAQTGVVGLTSNFIYSGNWWVNQPTNVLGIDPGDIGRIQALVNVALPIPALSVPLGDALAAILASQLPTNAGCTETSTGGCNNPLGILSGMFNLQNLFQMFSPTGYTFPATLNDPVTCDSSGNCNLANTNGPLMPWAGQTVSLDPFAPVTPGIINPTATLISNLTTGLMADPTGVTPLPDPVTTLTNLGTAIFNAFNPFVPLTQCGFCAPLAPGSGVTFSQAIQSFFTSLLSVIPGQTPQAGAATAAATTLTAATNSPLSMPVTAAPLAAASKVTPTVATGSQPASSDTQLSAPAVTGTTDPATPTKKKSLSDAAAALPPVSSTVVPGTGSGGTLTGGAKSFTDQLNSAVSKVTSGFKVGGDTTKTGSTSTSTGTGGTGTGGTGTGGTGTGGTGTGGTGK
jgi:hypothetical protein